MKKQLLLTFSICFYFSYSQEREMFFGKTLDNLDELPSVHIINKNTNQVTSSNTNGGFRIFAQANDTIQFTFVGYKTQTLVLQSSDFSINEKQIHLKKEIIELDEIELKKHNLTGNIETDLKQAPKDRIAELTQKIVLDLSNLDYDAIKQMPLGKDELHLQKVAAPSIPNSLHGAGVGVSLPDFYGIKKRALRKLIKFEEEFSNKLLSEFGSHFFFVELKIPKEKYYHFLEYCNPLGIENLYKEKRVIEVIKILRRESTSYLTLIK